MITLIPQSSAPNPFQLSKLYNSNCLFKSSISPIRVKFTLKRRRFHIQASSLVLPLLPFPIDQVLVPSEAKTLHLYEARYLALLEESLFKKKKLFVHFVLDPIMLSDTSEEASFAARYGCLVKIDKVEQLEVGALVSIRGVGRVKILEFKQASCFIHFYQVRPGNLVFSNFYSVLIGFLLTHDAVYHIGGRRDLGPLMWQVISDSQGVIIGKESLTGCVQTDLDCGRYRYKDVATNRRRLYYPSWLDKRFVPQEALMQTQTANSLIWAETAPDLDCDDAFIPSVAERVSFSALQAVSGGTKLEWLKLQKEKVTAMEMKDTLERLNKSIELVKNNISTVAAKLAIQSVL
ncbi:unnamed protein product [Fraxinus pennsylvanica]|uniref:Lon N-terminal domain-containing protein n=1 Tax=Fraxinus pennsylvanica TaxID=56036 RepID=A0AAD2AK39_9LAMI|nr:unnamed protein product [Fraxinus pennsylvanica]